MPVKVHTKVLSAIAYLCPISRIGQTAASQIEGTNFFSAQNRILISYFVLGQTYREFLHWLSSFADASGLAAEREQPPYDQSPDVTEFPPGGLFLQFKQGTGKHMWIYGIGTSTIILWQEKSSSTFCRTERAIQSFVSHFNYYST